MAEEKPSEMASSYCPNFAASEMQASRVAPQRFDPRQHIQSHRPKTQKNVPTNIQLDVQPNASPSKTARIANVVVSAPMQAPPTLESDNNMATTIEPPLYKPLGRFGYPEMMAAERAEDDVKPELELSKSMEEQLLEVSPEKNVFNPWLINHWRRVAKVRLLKDAYDGKLKMTFEDVKDDLDLLAAFIDNLDYFEEGADGVFCRKTGSKKSSMEIDWRFQNYATIADLKHFALTKPWPETAVPITLIEPRYILCLETDRAYDDRLGINELVKKFLRDGGELTLAECTYGSAMLMVEKSEESFEYLRVVALSYDQIEDSWLVAPIDSTIGPPMKALMKVRPDSFCVLPNVVSLQAIPAAIFAAPLRGLTGIKPGALDLARSCLYADVILTVTINERSCIMLPFYLEMCDGECPIDLMLIDQNGDGALEGQLVSEILYCKSLGIPIGPIELHDEHPFWMGNHGVDLPRPNLKRLVQELEEMEREEREGSQDLGSQRSLPSPSSSVGPSTKGGFLFEDAIRAGQITTQQQSSVPSENVVERKSVVVPGSIEKLLRSQMGEPRHRVMFRSMLTMLQGTSDVTRAELDYIITQFGCK
ncbi:unnamed protein product, partial [Mesorhabditis belari]|uniref:Uncharacterized protein n=1 Tax=Mesorhabditis belari TaxID=2138241 RepID=A0AAF3F442_9BILA